MAKKTIKAQMKQRRDTKANWASTNPVLLDGELGIVSDDPNLYKVGDGTTAWNALPFRGFDGTLAQELGKSENAAMSQKATTDKLTELQQLELKRYMKGVPFKIEPTLVEDKTIYRTDGTRVEINGYSTKFYNIPAKTNVKITLTQDFPSADIIVFGYKDYTGKLCPILISPVMRGINRDYYLTTSDQTTEIFITGCDLVGIYTEFYTEEDLAVILKRPIHGSTKEIAFTTDAGLYNKFGEFTASDEYDSRRYTIKDGTSLRIEINRKHTVDWIHAGVIMNDETFIPIISGAKTKGDVFYFTIPANIKDFISSGCIVEEIENNVATEKDITKEEKAVYGNFDKVEATGSNASAGQAWFLEMPTENNGRIESIFVPTEEILDQTLKVLIGTKKDADTIIVQSVHDTNISTGNNVLAESIPFKKGEYIGFYSETPLIGTIWGGVHQYACYASTGVPSTNLVGTACPKSSITIDFTISYGLVYFVPIKDLVNQTANKFNKTLVNVGHSIWWLDKTKYDERNEIDGQGTLCRGIQTHLQEQFQFEGITKYCYSGGSLGLGNSAASCIMDNQAPKWTAHANAIWTLDTITNDFGRSVPLGTTEDFDNNTGTGTFYGALRAFKNRVLELSPGAIVVCANALVRTDRASKENTLGLTLEDYEKAMCYAASLSGWYFVDQNRTSINEVNAPYTLYDGLHPTNFGYRIISKAWIEQFRILQRLY